MITAEHRKLKEEYTETSAEDTTSLDVYESEDVRENSIDALKKVYSIKQQRFLLSLVLHILVGLPV